MLYANDRWTHAPGLLLELIIRIMIRKLRTYLRLFGRHKNLCLVPILVISVLVLWHVCWWFAVESTRVLLPLPRPPPEQSLHHLRMNRSLQHYMNHIQVLIEPSLVPCATQYKVPVIILVASAPDHFDYRQAVRRTWAKYQLTFFIMGLHGDNADEQLVDNYIEAKQYGDIIVFNFHDHYQNLTLKTALMMQWTLDRCPQAQFMFKTDDDVMINPWTLRNVLKENVDSKLIGYRLLNAPLYRNEYNKWYIPRWLFNEEKVEEYLGGSGYFINGHYIQKILKKACRVPLVNLEDIYFTYLVALKGLGYKLTHDKRLSPRKPWLKLSCVYWSRALTHGFGPEEMVTVWSKVESLAKSYNNTQGICKFANSYDLYRFMY